MALVITNSDNYDAIADAIRAKTSSSTTYKPSEMASAISAIPGGGGITPSGTINITENGTYNVTTYASASVSIPIDPYMGKFDQTMTVATSDVTTVPYGAYAYTLNLSSANFPSATLVGSYAFAYCYKLQDIYFPETKSIYGYAFQYCSSITSLTSAMFPKVTSITGSAFRGCQYITTVSLSTVTGTLGAQAFSGCSRITTINLANVTGLGAGALSYNTTLTTVSLPKVATVGSSAFYSCWALSTLTLPAVTKFSAYAFRYCSTLMSLYLTGSTIPTLASTTVFANMPMSVSVGGVYGSIYVPSTLLDTYKAATYWSTYKNRIVAIST